MTYNNLYTTIFPFHPPTSGNLRLPGDAIPNQRSSWQVEGLRLLWHHPSRKTTAVPAAGVRTGILKIRGSKEKQHGKKRKQPMDFQCTSDFFTGKKHWIHPKTSPKLGENTSLIGRAGKIWDGLPPKKKGRHSTFKLATG